MWPGWGSELNPWICSQISCWLTTLESPSPRLVNWNSTCEQNLHLWKGPASFTWFSMHEFKVLYMWMGPPRVNRTSTCERVLHKWRDPSHVKRSFTCEWYHQASMGPHQASMGPHLWMQPACVNRTTTCELVFFLCEQVYMRMGTPSFNGSSRMNGPQCEQGPPCVKGPSVNRISTCGRDLHLWTCSSCGKVNRTCMCDQDG